MALFNRVVMSAMTRTRAGDDGVPAELMRDYYVQRASAGLMVTECTQVSDQGHGIIRCLGIHREDQVAGWRKVTDAVHAAGGRIICQIWHCGRVAHPDMRGGEQPVGPSPIPATGDFFLPSGRVDFPVPRELCLDEISGIVASFAAATRNARAHCGPAAADRSGGLRLTDQAHWRRQRLGRPRLSAGGARHRAPAARDGGGDHRYLPHRACRELEHAGGRTDDAGPVRLRPHVRRRLRCAP